MQEVKQFKSEREYLLLLVDYFKEEENLKQSLDAISADMKEADLNVAALKAAAKAIARGKEEELIDKSNQVLEAIELYTTTS